MAKKGKGKGGKGKSKGLFGAIGSALGSIPVVGKVKNAAKSVKKKVKKAKNKVKKKIKKAKKKLKKKIGKVYTKARKLKNNLSKSKLVKKIKRTAKKVVLTTKKVAKKTKSVAKTVTNAVKKATKKAVIFTKSIDIAQTISLAADFIPIVGNGKAAFETAFGFDPFTQDKLSAADRAIGSAGILGGGYAKAIGKGGKGALNFFSTGKNTTKTSESAAKSTTKNSKSATKDIEQKSSNKNTSSPTKGTGKETYQHLKDYKNNKYFTRSVEYNAGKDGTGFTYKVYQRGDIDWDMVRTKGAKKGRGLTNAEASAKHGLAPILDDAGSVATLHHSQQKGVGPLYEATTRYHNISNAKRAPLHPYKGKLNPFYPMDETTRGAFQKVDSINYWKTRGEEALGGK